MDRPVTTGPAAAFARRPRCSGRNSSPPDSGRRRGAICQDRAGDRQRVGRVTGSRGVRRQLADRLQHRARHLVGAAPAGVDLGRRDLPVQRRPRVEQGLERGARVDPGEQRAAVDMPVRRSPSASPTVRCTTRCPRSRSRVSTASTEPPPRASTPRCSISASATTSRSSARKASSPSWQEHVGDGLAGPPTMIASTSVNGTPSRRASTRPTVVLPAPGGPTRTKVGRLVGSPQRGYRARSAHRTALRPLVPPTVHCRGAQGRDTVSGCCC